MYAVADADVTLKQKMEDIRMKQREMADNYFPSSKGQRSEREKELQQIQEMTEKASLLSFADPISVLLVPT